MYNKKITTNIADRLFKQLANCRPGEWCVMAMEGGWEKPGCPQNIDKRARTSPSTEGGGIPKPWTLEHNSFLNKYLKVVTVKAQYTLI